MRRDRIEAKCMKCGALIERDKGAVFFLDDPTCWSHPDRQRDQAEAEAVIEGATGELVSVVMDELLALPERKHGWFLWCDVCFHAGDPSMADRNRYWLGLDDLRTFKDYTSATIHLGEKVWQDARSWSEVGAKLFGP